MKSKVWITSLMVCLVVSAFGQGTVVFNNGPEGLVERWDVYGPEPEKPIPVPPSDTSDHVQLVYAPAGTPAGPFGYSEPISRWVAANPGWALGPSSPFNVPNEPGLFDGGVVSLDGIAEGMQVSYAVYGEASETNDIGGTTEAFYRGLSAVFTTSTGTDAASAVPLADTFGGMVLLPFEAPEPSALLLAALGAAAMLLMRRRKPGPGSASRTPWRRTY